MYDCMVDLETMASDNNAAIVQIGAVAFNPKTEEITNEFSVNIDLVDAMRYGIASGSTIYWWFDQSEEVRKSIRTNLTPLWTALTNFNVFYKENRCRYLWSHSFDKNVLNTAYKALDIPKAFHYREELDLRTLQYLLPSGYSSKRYLEETTINVPHVAVNDARRQAIVVQEAFKLLNLK